MNFKITCTCGRYITKNDNLHLLSCYKVQIPTLKKASDGSRVIEEYFYTYICPQCNRDVVVIRRTARKATGKIQTLKPCKLIGESACAYLELTANNRINKTNTLCYSDYGNSVKGMPLRYAKTINSNTQRLRYINECAYDGDRIKTEVLIYN